MFVGWTISSPSQAQCVWPLRDRTEVVSKVNLRILIILEGPYPQSDGVTEITGVQIVACISIRAVDTEKIDFRLVDFFGMHPIAV